MLGFADLIDWHCSAISQSNHETITTQRISSAVDQHLGRCLLLARQEILRLLLHLVETANRGGCLRSPCPATVTACGLFP